MIGMIVEIARAARKTSSSVDCWMVGSRTESGWIAGLGSTRSGQRKSFQDAMVPVYAKFANTPKLQDLVKRIRESAK